MLNGKDLLPAGTDPALETAATTLLKVLVEPIFWMLWLFYSAAFSPFPDVGKEIGQAVVAGLVGAVSILFFGLLVLAAAILLGLFLIALLVLGFWRNRD